MHSITREQALNESRHSMVWRAILRTGEVIWEQPGVSSDKLPRDSVVQIDYVPRDDAWPTIEAPIDLSKGERFVRYWTTIWSPSGRGCVMLYVLGVESGGKHALLCYYPHVNKIVFAAQRPFSPAWTPAPFGLLPSDATITGGPGQPYFGWVHDGFGGVAISLPGKRIRFQGNYG